MTPAQKMYALDQYVNHGKTPVTISKELGLKFFQPVYEFLRKEGVFEYRRNIEKSNRKYELNERFFETIDTEEKAYCLGFIVADGSVDEHHNRVRITLHQKDRDILEKMSRAAGSTSPVVHVPSKNQYKISFNSKLMVEDLARLGVFPRKSLTMDASMWEHIPVDLQRHFLRGYLDGDGNIFLNRKYSSGVKFLVQVIGTREFLEGTFNKFYKTTCKLYKYRTCEMYCWKLSSKHACMDFLSKIYDNSVIYLERKFQQYSECAHLKPRELSGSLTVVTEGNQQPSSPTMGSAGSETIETPAEIWKVVEYAQAGGSAREACIAQDIVPHHESTLETP